MKKMKAFCPNPKCKSEVRRFLLYDDKYVAGNKLGKDGYGTWCLKCDMFVFIEKRTFKTYTAEQIWGKPKYPVILVAIDNTGKTKEIKFKDIESGLKAMGLKR